MINLNEETKQAADNNEIDQNDIQFNLNSTTTQEPDHKEEDHHNMTPEDNAGLLSHAFVLWMWSLFTISKRRRHEGKELQQEDLWDPLKSDSVYTLDAKFDNAWKRARRKIDSKRTNQDSEGSGSEEEAARPSITDIEARSVLLSSIWAVVGHNIIRGFVFKVITTCCQIALPILLLEILTYLEDSASRPISDGYTLVVVIGVVMGLDNVLALIAIRHQNRTFMNIQTALSARVYHKALHLSSSSRQERTVGEIVNYMQLDGENIGIFLGWCNATWEAPVLIIVYLILLYSYIGWPVLAGFGAIFVCLPVALILIRVVARSFSKVAKVRDERIEATNEMLQGILGVKMSAWEDSFEKSISGIRATEIKHLRVVMFVVAFLQTLGESVTPITATTSIVVYALSGGEVKATLLFTTIAVFQRLRVPLKQLPLIISALAQANISVNRLAPFFALDEIDVEHHAGMSQPTSTRPATSATAIRIKHGEFCWSDPHDTPIVKKKARSMDVNGDVSKSSNKNDREAVGAPEDGLGDCVPTPHETPDADTTINTPTRSSNVSSLVDVNIDIKRGDLVAVVGAVGSGKTSLCCAILGECFRKKGQVYVNGTTAYASQTAWILSATIRDNILFGELFDQDRYTRVLDVCQLTHDLELFAAGDKTMVGERGITLSGGQKQRVSVARVAYSRKEIIVFDDPLSALDPGVAARLFKDCIVDFLSDRTRVLVTNKLDVLGSCDWIVGIDVDSDDASLEPGDGGDDSKQQVPGRIAVQGTWKVLSTDNSTFAGVMQKFNSATVCRRASIASEQGGENATADTDDNKGQGLNNAAEADDSLSKNEKLISDNLISQEERSVGAVQWSVYKAFMEQAGGALYIVPMMLFFVLVELFKILGPQWVAIWSELADDDYQDFTWWSGWQPNVNEYNESSIEANEIDDDDDEVNLLVPLTFFAVGYAVIGLASIFVKYMASVLTAVINLKASTSLHQRLLHSILHARMSFFDQTPLGRVISRFSRDIKQADMIVYNGGEIAISSMLSTVSTLAVISYSTPIFAAAVPFIALAYIWILQNFRPVKRDLARLQALARSPVFSHLSETLYGVTTIRAFGSVDAFLDANKRKLEAGVRTTYAQFAAGWWLAMCLGSLGAVVVVLSVAAAVYAASVSPSDPMVVAQAGVSLTFAFSFTQVLAVAVGALANLEAAFNAVDRLIHYSTKIEHEASGADAEYNAHTAWPSEGRIVVKNLQMRYRPDRPLVLRGVTFTVEGGQRVGIVGRTGCGKSSLLLSLLRLVEPVMGMDGQEGTQRGSGPITLDGVDITKIPLVELRRAIGIVPQNPVIFKGTLRFNIDPFDQYTDAQIWDALDKCSLKTLVSSYEHKLQHEVREHGANFSQGQRQLIVIARALLDKCKVLLLDEATSSIDFETDELIQKTFRSPEVFGGCTVLTIAHRINTVIDSDRILVMKEGVVAEYDEPSVLLANPNSMLSAIAGSSFGSGSGSTESVAGSESRRMSHHRGSI